MALRSATDTAADAGDYAFDWAIVDVETSGLRPALHRVLSVAVVTVDPGGRRTEEYSTLVDPGCDPGPVHVHGLTADMLRGAPDFSQVAGRVAAMLQDRVMVAHNAQFDYDFLTGEFSRAGLRLPVAQRLCTLALNRRLGLPTKDMRLGTLAVHYGISTRRAHDALDDARVLAGVLQGSLTEARRLGLPLPLAPCPPAKGGRSSRVASPSIPKTPCAFRNPGHVTAGGPLVQGMKIAITGPTATSRMDLVARAVAAGLNVMTSVSRHTSALVTNDSASGSAKARRALSEAVPIVDERTFLHLLCDVRPGTPHTAPARAPGEDASTPEGHTASAVSEPQTDPASAVSTTTPETAPDPEPGRQRRPEATADAPGVRSLMGRRVLVLGGTHAQASAARSHVVGLGGAAAVNLSASVTEVVALPGGDADRRMHRVVSLGLPVRDVAWLQALNRTEGTDGGVVRPEAALILPRGGAIDLPVTVGATRWTVAASWRQQAECEIDVVAFILDEDEQVSCDEDFVFYGAPEHPSGNVRLSVDGPEEQSINVNLTALPAAAHKIAIAAAIDGTATFGDAGAIEISASPGTGESVLAQATLDAATTECTLILAEVYRRGPSWRLRAVGQGYDHGLDQLAGDYGVDIED